MSLGNHPPVDGTPPSAHASGPGGANPAAGGAEAAPRGAAAPASWGALLDVSMPVVVEIGRATLPLQDLLELEIGSVVQLDCLVGDPVDVYVSDRKLARGEIVTVGDRFGVRITQVLAQPGSGAEAA